MFIAGASPLRGDRAIRSNSSDLPMQILRDFRFYPLRVFTGDTPVRENAKETLIYSIGISPTQLAKSALL
jgi:hypothetical protein